MCDQSSFNAELLAFLRESVTPFHAVAAMRRRLQAAGFVPLSEDQPWRLEPGGRYFLLRNGSSVVAFIWGSEHPPLEGMRMVGAHTDSPCLMVKPNPERLRQGCFQLGVEVYGGALLNPWFDRDLSLAGLVSYADGDGRLRTALVDFEQPVAFIPSLAIHLDREANNSRKVNPQTDILPVLSLHSEAGSEPVLRQLLAERLSGAGEPVAQVLDYELCLYDSQPAALVGLQRELISGARLDNLLSCFMGLSALLSCDGRQSALLACNDHEEVGSTSAVGALGPMLRTLLARVAGAGSGSEAGDEAALAALIERSMLISADNAHAIHPNFADRHDDRHGPRMNAGPVIKLNANQRYATTSQTAGLFRLLAAQEEVPVQSFVVRTDMPCGSTIGPLTAATLGVRTLDVGVPTLGMHSIRELAGAADSWALTRVLRAFMNHPAPLISD
jgi:aspartyl aminopeptidase